MTKRGRGKFREHTEKKGNGQRKSGKEGEKKNGGNRMGEIG